VMDSVLKTGCSAGHQIIFTRGQTVEYKALKNIRRRNEILNHKIRKPTQRQLSYVRRETFIGMEGFSSPFTLGEYSPPIIHSTS